MADCAACGKPVPDVAYVCHPCAFSGDKQPLGLAPRLRQAAKLWLELETTITRQARMSEPGPRARGHAPPQPIRPGLGDPADDHQRGVPAGLPFNWSAADVRDSVHNTVTTWGRVVLEERGGVGPVDAYTETVMRWLATQLGWCRYQRWADELWDQVGDACGLVAPAVDRPRPRVDAGLCLAPTQAGPCQQRLSAAPAAAYVHCPGCRTTHRADERRETILNAARDSWLFPDELAALLTTHAGLRTTDSMIRNLAARRRILSDGAGRYLVREVEQLRLARLGRRAMAAT